MTHLINDIYGVDILKYKSYKEFLITNGNLYYFDIYEQEYFEIIKLPSGSYSIIGKGDELDEKTAREIVGKHPYSNFVESARKTLATLLQSKSLKPETTLLIKKH